MSLRDEILEQPDALRRQLAGAATADGVADGAATWSPPTGRHLDALAERLRNEPVESVLIAARGTSDHAAIYGQYVLGVRNRLAVALATPSVVSLYGVEPRVRRSLVVGISQSGASPDIVAVLAAARREGAPTLAITNDPSSELAAAAEYVVDLAAGPELAVAATKTYTTSLLAIARLSLALDPAEDAARELHAVPDAVAAALAPEPAVEQIAGALARAPGGLDRCVVVGRGFEYATAREWALKLKELGRVFADPYSAADFLHGPIALVHAGIPVLVVAPSGVTLPGMLELLRDLRGRDVDAAVVSDDEGARDLGRWSIPIPASVPEWLRPIVSIVPAQLFAYHATLARGLDPDEPRYISKVTRTL